LKIIIEIDEKKEVYGNLVDTSKSDGQNAGPAPKSLAVESITRGIAEIYPHTDPSVIDGGTPPQHLLEALQATTSSEISLHAGVTDNAGPAPSSDVEYRFYYAKGCCEFISKIGDDVQKMKYLFLLLESYNKYLTRNTKFEIKDID
jgi:hypothetical protein